jgi:hypothetical protein
LSQLGIEEHPTGEIRLADICERVERLRGRPLRLAAVATGPSWPSGLWIETRGVDYVVFDRATSALHQVHIICHEVGHMLLGHVGTAIRAEIAEVRQLLQADPRAPVMMRTGYADEEEREAEVFATMACERIGDPATPLESWFEVDHAELPGRLLAALGDHMPSVRR